MRERIKELSNEIKEGDFSSFYAGTQNGIDNLKLLFKTIDDQQKEIWELNKEIGKYSNMVSDIEKSQMTLADETRKLAKIMLLEGNTP